MILSSERDIREYTTGGWWGTTTLGHLFQQNAARNPQAVALVDPPNRAELAGGDPRRYSYAELQSLVDRLAASWLELGLGKDDIVMVQLPNVAELVIAYLAAARLGVILSPVPMQYRTHELRQILAILEPKAHITITSFGGFNHVEMVRGLQADCPSLKTLMALGADLPQGVHSLTESLAAERDTAAVAAYAAAHPQDANEVFTICWTSGTEAEPKGVPRSHNLWITIAYATTDGAQLQPGDTLLNPFPMVNMSAIGGMLVPWLLTGGKLVMHHPLNLPLFLGQITTEKVNYTVAPPVLLNMLLANPALLANVDLSAIRAIGSGSAPLSSWMVSEWKSRHNIDVTNFFGANEGTALISDPRDIPSPSERARFFPRFGAPGLTWTNRAVQGMSTKLVDPLTGQTLSEAGEVGELAMKGPTIFAGYYKRPELTEKAFDAQGYFYTGDLFAIDGEAGQRNRYRFVGRRKDLIIRGGMKISPEELEGLLQEHPAVAEAAVIGQPDKRLDDERICAVVVFKKDLSATLSELQDFLKAKDIAAYKMPKKLEVVPALPRNPLGKILKRELREKLVGQAEVEA